MRYRGIIIEVMANTNVIQREIDMALIRSPQSLNSVKELYQTSEDSNMVLISYFLRPNQKAIIDTLSKHTGKGKAEVMRDIIDEWCETQLERSPA